MSSEFDKLVEAITDLVVSEIACHRSGSVQASPSASVSSKATPVKGASILVAPGPGRVETSLWAALGEAASVNPSVLVWNGCRRDQLPSACGNWKVETRTTNWPEVVAGHKAVVLLGTDLAGLAAVANLGCGGGPPASLAVAALASGMPVFVDNHRYEGLRRHSSRLASGFVGRFEEFYRLVSSFGVEFGGAGELRDFLNRLERNGPEAPSSPGRSGGRDVVTVEDVEAVHRSQQKRICVAIGSIVTPLAAQRASEWGIEVVFQ